MSDFEDANDSFDEADATYPLTGLRKRRPIWDGVLNEDLPGLDEVKVTEVLRVGLRDLDLGALVNSSFREPAGDFMRKVWSASWSVCNFRHLPHWLQDNDYLHDGHRPPLPSFKMCFKSIFRIHTETGNIWTHLLGCVAFIAVLLVFMTRPSEELPLSDKIAIGTFFVGAITCLGLSFVFHTVYCHSEFVGKLFSKLDYCGIAILITGSFVPWLYYGFYCQIRPRIIYLTVVIVLGIASIVVSLWDKFSESRFRPLRAGVFAVFGLSGVIPAVHYALAEGWLNALTNASLGWLILMGSLYLLGAFLYAFRVPECLYPGKFDIWFQSHQIFHVLVIAAAFVHLHGITEMLTYRMSIGACAVQSAALVL
ncbi:adiponectin receptor isoform X2 [Rhodnius prolixus]|uniref:adiponectin receptor isoform X2 n=1 Tax=Rhodnius prolixus TaxID=13249 RepID=UPI003D18C30F